MRQVILSTLLLAFAPFLEASETQEPKPDADGWFRLFDGKSLAGWKAAEFPQAFKVEDGVISAGATPLAHLYYVGPVRNATFKDFELKAEVKTRPKGNSGIIFHTEFQDKETTLPHEAKAGRTLGTGTLAIQSHDPGSMVYFRSIRVKPLE